MPITWELRDCDQEFFERELRTFVPDKLFDAHAHLYRKFHWGGPTALDAGPDTVGLQEYRQQMTWIAPEREITGLFFGVGFHEDFRVSNEFVAKEIAPDKTCFGHLLVPPTFDPDQLRDEVRRLGMRGLKVYHTFIVGKPSWNADVS